MQYIPHVVTLTLYIAVAWLAAVNLWNVRQAHNNPTIRAAIRAYTIMAIYSCSLFVFNQANWVIESHGRLVGSFAEILWIHGDHAVALTWLFGQCLLRVYLNFRLDEEKALRRRKDDP